MPFGLSTGTGTYKQTQYDRVQGCVDNSWRVSFWEDIIACSPHRLPLRGERLLLPLRGVALHPLSAALLDGNQPTTEEGLSRGAARQKTFAAERQTMSKCQSGNWRYRETKRTPAVAGVLEKIHLTFCYFPFNRIGVPGTQSAGIGRR